MKSLHRWAGLVCALLWLVQALTGIAIVFRWEADDATISAAARPVSVEALGRRIEAMQQQGSTVSSMWASGGTSDRFDIFHEIRGEGHTTRVDGAGTILRERADKEGLVQGGIWDTLTRLHQNLFAGEVGAWIVGVSGVILLSNLVLGLKLAWPRRWTRRLLLRRPEGSPAARTYGWHRQLGLLVVVPAMATVSAGVLLVFIAGVEQGLNAELGNGATPSSATGRIAHSEALGVALARYPGSTISGFSLPGDEQSYRIRLNVPGETQRIYGATTVLVGQADGSILLDHDARRSPWNRWLVETLYPFHTGQVGGPVGRLLQLAIGLWLITMILLGIRLWWLRRRRRLK